MSTVKEISEKIVDVLDKNRRKRVAGNYSSESSVSEIEKFVALNQTIKLVLPCFHFKSINKDSVLTDLPDAAEYIAIKNLEALCDGINKIYSPGCQLTIIHEGRIIKKEIGIAPSDEVINQYVKQLHQFTKHPSIKFHTIKDYFPQINSYSEMRERFYIDFAPSLAEIDQMIEKDENVRNRYVSYKCFCFNEYTPVLLKDATTTQKKELSKKLAKDLLQEYFGFSKLVAQHHNDAIRLSIFGHAPGVAKFGINLIPGGSQFGAPWFNTLVKKLDGTYELMKKVEAVRRGYQLVLNHNQQPWCYVERVICDTRH